MTALSCLRVSYVESLALLSWTWNGGQPEVFLFAEGWNRQRQTDETADDGMSSKMQDK